MEFFIPLIVIGLVVMVTVGFLFARGRMNGPARSGPHPDDRRGLE